MKQTQNDNEEDTKGTLRMVYVYSIRGYVLWCCGAVTQTTKVLKSQRDSFVSWVCTCTKRIIML